MEKEQRVCPTEAQDQLKLQWAWPWGSSWSPNEPDAVVGAKSKKTRSRVKPANKGEKATDIRQKARLVAKTLPTCHRAGAEEWKCPAGQPKAKLPPTHHLTASNKLDGEESITSQKETGGAQDSFLDKENLVGHQPRSGCCVQTKLDAAAGATSAPNKPHTIGHRT